MIIHASDFEAALHSGCLHANKVARPFDEKVVDAVGKGGVVPPLA